ncbi:MAG: hypothetical protein QXS48_00295 [Candidatus Aenigmatarchaeota archaeon]
MNWSGVLYGGFGCELALCGAIAASSSNDILCKIAGITLVVSGSMIAYAGFVEDTMYEKYKLHEALYKGLKNLYKKLIR